MVAFLAPASVSFVAERTQTLDLAPLNTANVTDMTSMFKGCSSLTTVYVSDQFTTNSFTQWDDMFMGCTALVGATAYDENKADISRANYRYGFFKTYYQIGSKTYDLSGAPIIVDNLDVRDGEGFITYAPFTATEARYSRYNMTSNWATLCLPFAVDADNTDDCTFYGLSSIDDAANTITLKKMTGTIDAGTPVFVYSIRAKRTAWTSFPAMWTWCATRRKACGAADCNS